jgi:hypothetical protein
MLLYRSRVIAFQGVLYIVPIGFSTILLLLVEFDPLVYAIRAHNLLKDLLRIL